MSRITQIFYFAWFVAFFAVAPAYAANFGLFGDITFNESDEAGTNNAFALGGLDFYATQEISDDTRVFVEFVLENIDTGLVTDLERLWISHTFDDKLVLAAGRFHTPLGNWNRTYHHGAILQDTISRPFFLDFEDGAAGILPVHIVGMMATGDFETNSGELSYEFGIGNGPSINTSSAGFNASASNKPEIEINNTSDANTNKAMVLRGIYKLDAIPLQFGASIMSSKIAESSEGNGSAVAQKGDTLVDQNIFGLDVLYEHDDFDVMAEYYYFTNKNQVGVSGTYNASAYYIQFGYRITETLKAIARYEDLSIDANDTYFRVLGTQEASHNVIGLRYDVDDSNALKFEINQTDFTVGTDTTTYKLQWAFLVP